MEGTWLVNSAISKDLAALNDSFIPTFIHQIFIECRQVLSAEGGTVYKTDKNSYLPRASVLIDHKFNPKQIQ